MFNGQISLEPEKHFFGCLSRIKTQKLQFLIFD